MISSTYSLGSGKNGVLTPKIPVKLTNPDNGKSVPVFALIDTGADSCTMPYLLAINLGYDMSDKSKSKKLTTGVSGKPIESYTHKMLIEVYDQSRSKVIKAILVDAEFLKNNVVPPILGTSGFLEKFKITMDYINKQITIQCE